jgi:hypothetical protein
MLRLATSHTNVARDCEILVWLHCHNVSGMNLQRAVYKLHFHYISYISIFGTPIVREMQKILSTNCDGNTAMECEAMIHPVYGIKFSFIPSKLQLHGSESFARS